MQKLLHLFQAKEALHGPVRITAGLIEPGVRRERLQILGIIKDGTAILEALRMKDPTDDDRGGDRCF